MTELLAADTGLLVVDFQARLCAAMPEAVVAKHAKNVTHLLALAEELGLPVVVTEQYPQGLGPTLDTIAEALPADTPRHAKTMFSAWRDPGAAAALKATGRRRWVVTGMEAHICVVQTVRDLCAQGFVVHVPADAVVSRTKANWRTGLQLAAGAGATVTCTETALFDLLQEARGAAFKRVSRLIR